MLMVLLKSLKSTCTTENETLNYKETKHTNKHTKQTKQNPKKARIPCVIKTMP